MFRFTVSVGQVLSFEYPAHNRWGIPLEFREREITVTAVRDLRADPLDVEAVIRDPLRRRGSVLITGIDQDLQESRSFWLESMKFSGVEFARPAYRLAVFSSEDADDDGELLPDVFQNCPLGATLLTSTIKHFQDSIPANLRIKVIVECD